MNSKLSCHVCCEDFTVTPERLPRILKVCGHTLCSYCISHMLSNRLGVLCPICRVESRGISLSDFPKNFSVLDMLSEPQFATVCQDGEGEKDLDIRINEATKDMQELMIEAGTKRKELEMLLEKIRNKEMECKMLLDEKKKIEEERRYVIEERERRKNEENIRKGINVDHQQIGNRLNKLQKMLQYAKDMGDRNKDIEQDIGRQEQVMRGKERELREAIRESERLYELEMRQRNQEKELIEQARRIEESKENQDWLSLWTEREKRVKEMVEMEEKKRRDEEESRIKKVEYEREQIRRLEDQRKQEMNQMQKEMMNQALILEELKRKAKLELEKAKLEAKEKEVNQCVNVIDIEIEKIRANCSSLQKEKEKLNSIFALIKDEDNKKEGDTLREQGVAIEKREISAEEKEKEKLENDRYYQKALTDINVTLRNNLECLKILETDKLTALRSRQQIMMVLQTYRN